MDWTAILVPTVAVPELIVRGTLIYLSLVLLLRVAGQRESGGLGLTDLLVVVLIADAAGVGLTGAGDTVGDGLVVAATVLVWSVVLDAVAYRWPSFARIVKARPQPLISDGQLNRRVMRREFLAEEEVLAQLRLHGISELAMVARAYLEPNGMISIIPRQASAEAPARAGGRE